MRRSGWLALGLGLAVTGRAVTTNFYYVSPEWTFALSSPN